MTIKRIPSNKLTLADCRMSAKERGGRCLSSKYVNIFYKMKWTCSLKHVWYATYTNIRNKNHWCPKCSSRRKITISFCKDFAASKSGKCLSNTYTNARINMVWECNLNHNWETTADKILNRVIGALYVDI